MHLHVSGGVLLNDLPRGAHVLADRVYDANWIRELIKDQGFNAQIPFKSNRKDDLGYSKQAHRRRNFIEGCFNKLKQFRHIATRDDRSAFNYLAMAKLASIRLWLRFNRSGA
jgi:transposase